MKTSGSVENLCQKVWEVFPEHIEMVGANKLPGLFVMSLSQCITGDHELKKVN